MRELGVEWDTGQTFCPRCEAVERDKARARLSEAKNIIFRTRFGLHEKTAICERCGTEYTRKILLLGEREYTVANICIPCCNRERDERIKRELVALLAQEDIRRREWWKTRCGNPPLLFTSKGFDAFDSSLHPAAFEKMNSWTGQSLILYSPGVYGVGKTHLAVALALKLLDGPAAYLDATTGEIKSYPCPVHFVTESDLLARIRSTYDRGAKETEGQVYQSLRAITLLIVDDVGKMKPRDPSFLQGVYYRLVDERYGRGQRIIITTNLSLQELEEHIGGASADRLRAMCGKDGMVKMGGESYRR